MDNHAKFWLAVWQIVGICFCITALSVSGCTVVQSLAIERAIKNGAEPIRANCAISTCSTETLLTLGLSK